MACKFELETQRTNGDEYTPQSLYLLLSRYMQNCQNDVNFFQVLNLSHLKIALMQSLNSYVHAKGIGANRKETPAFRNVMKLSIHGYGLCNEACHDRNQSNKAMLAP